MKDWPVEVVEPLVTIHTWSLESIGAVLGSMGIPGGTGIKDCVPAAYPAANLALFIPFSVTKPIIAVKLFCFNGAVNGNIDMGIYDVTGTRLVSNGSVAQAGVTILQEFDIADTRIGPGVFYLALALDNNVGQQRCVSLGGALIPSVLGMAEMAAAFPLPANAVFATITNNYIPLLGLTTRAVL